MKIGELAKRLGVAPSKIRFWEDNGLIPPARRLSSGYRDYDAAALETLQIVLQAQSFGFTLKEIQRSLVETRTVGRSCDYLVKRLSAKRNDLDRHIEQACALRARMTQAIDELAERGAANARLEPQKRAHGPLKAAPPPVHRAKGPIGRRASRARA